VGRVGVGGWTLRLESGGRKEEGVAATIH